MPTTDPALPCRSRDEIQALWRTLNLRYFAGALLPIEIVWSSRLTSSAGLFVTRVGPRHADRSPGRRCIRLSIPLLGSQPFRELTATLAHEMIHQWQYDVLKRRPNHGADFGRKMREISRSGLSLTVRHHLDHLVEAFSRYVWTCARCGEVYRRQRRTIRPRRHRCGRCNGALREGPGSQPHPLPAFSFALRAAGRRARGRPLQLGLPFASGSA